MRRPTFLLTACLVAAILLPLTLAVRISTATGATAAAGARPWVYAGLGLLLLVLLAAMAIGLRDLSRSLAGVDPEATAIAARLGERPEQQRLVARWLRRSRWFRNVGGVAGVLAGLPTGGIGGIVLLGLIGLTAGSLAAELHLLGADRFDRGSTATRTRVAGLERRSLPRYWEPRREAALAFLGLIGIGLVVADRLGRVDPGLRAGWAVAVVAVVVSAFGIQWRVATRRRPALPESLRSSDDLVRSLAVTSGIANPALSLALALLGQALSETAPFVSAVCWLAALALYWRFRRLGFDWLLREPPLGHPSAVAA